MSLPLSKGLGLRSAVRSREAVDWASWADCLPTVQKRHPQVAGIMLQRLNGGGEMASLNVARECIASLADASCVFPSLFELVDGVRPPVPEDTGDPFQPRQNWQHFASNLFGFREDHSRQDRSCVARLRDSPSSRPSLSVCCSSVVSTCPSPCPPATEVWPSTRLGHHGSACAVARDMGRRGFAVESAIARISREGARACQ